MSQYSKLFFLFLLCIFSPSFWGMVATDAESRLNFVKELYQEMGPWLDMDTEIGERLFTLYEYDRDLIREKTKDREDYSFIVDRLKDIDAIVLPWRESFCFMDYHIIGYLWACILSKPELYGINWTVEDILYSKRHPSSGISSVTLRWMEGSHTFRNFLPIPHSGIPGIVMPLISLTGLVDIYTINRSLAFTINGRSYFVSFCALPYGEQSNNDAFFMWMDDYCILINRHTSSFTLYLQRTAKLLQELDSLSDPLEKSLAHYAFHMMFYKLGIFQRDFRNAIRNNNKKWRNFLREHATLENRERIKSLKDHLEIMGTSAPIEGDFSYFGDYINKSIINIMSREKGENIHENSILALKNLGVPAFFREDMKRMSGKDLCDEINDLILRGHQTLMSFAYIFDVNPPVHEGFSFFAQEFTKY